MSNATATARENETGKYFKRFNRTYREEVLDLYIFSRLSEVREITER